MHINYIIFSTNSNQKLVKLKCPITTFQALTNDYIKLKGEKKKKTNWFDSEY